MERIFVKPPEGSMVKDPQTLLPLPERGKQVPASSYWLRRLRDGDVVRAEPGEAPKKKKKAKKAEPKPSAIETNTEIGMEAESNGDII